MTGEEAVDEVFRLAAEAGVELGEVGRSPYFREMTISRLDANPTMIPPYLAQAREEIEKRKAK